MSSGTPIPYTKWFKGFSSYSSAAPSRRLQKGEILDSGFDDQSKNPPTNGEAFTLEDEVVIPYDLNQQEQPEAIIADVTVTYTAEDWGAAYLDDALIINLTSDKENPSGQYGGHQTWAKTLMIRRTDLSAHSGITAAAPPARSLAAASRSARLMKTAFRPTTHTIRHASLLKSHALW